MGLCCAAPAPASAAEPPPSAGSAAEAAEEKAVPLGEAEPTAGADEPPDGSEVEIDEDDYDEDDYDEDDYDEDDYAYGSYDEPAAETKPTGPPPPIPEPPRPGELPEIETPAAPVWRRHLEVGGGAVFVSRPLFGDLPNGTPRYQPGVGFGVDVRWDLLSFLRIHPYFLHVTHGVPLPPGALATEAHNSISQQTVFPETTAASFSFGAKAEPTWWLNHRLRAWLCAGVGWGRLRIPVQAAFDPALPANPQDETAGNLFLQDRAFSFVEFPLGMGAGFDIIERWLALNYDLAVVPVVGQSGDAIEPFQGIDANGQVRDIGPLEPFDVYFFHSLNLALIL